MKKFITGKTFCIRKTPRTDKLLLLIFQVPFASFILDPKFTYHENSYLRVHLITKLSLKRLYFPLWIEGINFSTLSKWVFGKQCYWHFLPAIILPPDQLIVPWYHITTNAQWLPSVGNPGGVNLAQNLIFQTFYCLNKQ